jgi:flagellar biosynthetic protein FliP
MNRVRLVAAALLLVTGLSALPAQETEQASTVTPPGEDALRIPFVDLQIREPETNSEVALSLQLLLLLAVLSLAPSLIIILTSFLRIAIVFDFVKRSLSLQQVPPAQVLMGIALFLTVFIMWPTLTQIYDNAFAPFAAGDIGVEEAYHQFEAPMRIFMYRQMQGNPDYIRLFMRIGGMEAPATFADVPTFALIPAFILHELTVAFKIGILLFIPFIIIDMVVASTLMSMGMIMLPPIMISLPFKLILFVLVDGWSLITQQLVASFGG